ncbi:putative non-specific serine/threonine protein kinase [Rosa chinensis]|uniref:Putative non-specific serine/threonine protein kinase n=1 Tax=Rosa chinensis TaxID=74649 RepID=A0A2P6QSX7_ROSCH|nr:putative non-specific serine/threonine protein kinase [Rosa chinensis]
MSGRSSIHSGSVLARLLWLVIVSSAASCCCSSAAVNISTSSDVIVRCMEREKHALLQFKQGLVDDSNALASWESKEDCCEWGGVACDNQTGHVIMLDLYYNLLGGEIGPSLLELPYLYYLDLGYNSFNGTIPKSIGSLSRLKVLKLAFNFFSGSIPPQLGNLSNLHTLDLSSNSVTFENLKWVSQLSSLRYLNMSYLNFSRAVNWPQSISQLPSLMELRLILCQLPDVDMASLSFINSSTSLQVLHLPYNFLGSSVFCWIGNVSRNLVSIDLHDNRMKGPIPNAFTNMDFLLSLDLSYNQLEGGIPKSFRSLCRLETLNLLSNNFSDRLEQSIGNLSCAQDTLKSLYLGDNLWWGSFPDDLTRFVSLQELDIDNATMSGSLPKSFRQLSQLRTLRLGHNRLSGSFPDVTGLSLLSTIDLSHNQLNGSLHDSLGQLSSLTEIDLSRNSLNVVLTEVHFLNLSQLLHVDVSYNPAFSFRVSLSWNPPFQLDELKMASCKVGPAFPKWTLTQRRLSRLDLSNAGISDSIPDNFWDLPCSLSLLNLSINQIHGRFPNLTSRNCRIYLIDLSSNRFCGALPPFHKNVSALLLSKNKFTGDLSSICSTQAPSLEILDLFYNLLSGELPNCWFQFKELLALNLANNSFSGKIPSSFGSLESLYQLQLQRNNFSGELPSLENCTRLVLVDLGFNNLSGKIQAWIGSSLKEMWVLQLRSNHFCGSIPSSICSLPLIRVLDLSQNNISGVLPRCLNNLTAFSLVSQEVDDLPVPSDFVLQHIWKGAEREYRQDVRYLRSFDISSNNLTGVIPENITYMLGLRSLNLSRNNLTGLIPGKFGQLEVLEVLDLSRNHLSGSIPDSFTNLHSLAVLNLSINNLSGRIPSSTQLLTFIESSFAGNVGLCGTQLNTKCPGDGPSEDPEVTGGAESDGFITTGFYVSIEIGFFTGFVGVCLTLLRKTSWRCSSV